MNDNLTNHEREIAIMEGELIAAEDEYFEARPQLDRTIERQRIYEAGFRAAWRAKPLTRATHQWQPVTRVGQIKLGDFIRFRHAGQFQSRQVQFIVNDGTDAEEVIYDREKNYYLITSMFLDGTGAHKNVQILAEATDTAAEQDQVWRGMFKLIEEAGEVLQILGKLGPFPSGIHPDKKGDLQTRLNDELGDLVGAVDYFVAENPLNPSYIAQRAEEKAAKFTKWKLTGVPAPKSIDPDAGGFQ